MCRQETLWTEGTEPGRQAVALGIAASLTVVAFDVLAVEDEGESVVLVVPWLEGGSLHDRVALRGPLPAGAQDLRLRADLSRLERCHVDHGSSIP